MRREYGFERVGKKRELDLAAVIFESLLREKIKVLGK